MCRSFKTQAPPLHICLLKHSTLRICDAGCPASQEKFPTPPLLLHDPAEFSWTLVTTVISTWMGGDHEVPHFMT